MKTAVFTLALIPLALVAQRRAPALATPRPITPTMGSGPTGGASSFVPAPIASGVLGTSGALGGAFLSPGFSRPLGGITPPRTPVIRPSRRTSRYFGPIYYVPNAFDTYGSVDIAASEARAARLAAGASAPVIVNQYFGSKEGDYSQTEYTSSAKPPASDVSAAAPGDPIGPQENYYLIAYKDHSIYSALAYWVEDGTLHYVTTQNTHNQASLGLIDVEQTTKLNSDHGVPFSLSR